MHLVSVPINCDTSFSMKEQNISDVTGTSNTLKQIKPPGQHAANEENDFPAIHI